MTLSAATYEWTGGGDGKSLFQEANWAESGSGKQIGAIEPKVSPEHDLLIERGNAGGGHGFKPHLRLGGRTLTVRGGKLRGMIGKEYGGGIQTDGKPGGKRSKVILEGGNTQVWLLVDIVARLSGDANLQVANPWAPLKNSEIDLDPGFQGALIFTRRTPANVRETELAMIRVDGAPASEGANVELAPIEKGCLVRLLDSKGGKPPVVAAKQGTSMKPPAEAVAPKESEVETGPRTWTDIKGRSITGQIVAADEANAVVEVSGKPTTICIGDLSKADREYVSRWRAAHPENLPTGRIAAAMAKAEEAAEKVEVPETPRAAKPDGVVRSAVLGSIAPLQTGPPPEFSVETVSEDGDASSYVYASPHFEFRSDRRLTSRVISGFSLLYEATYQAVCSMPWGLELDPGKGNEKFIVKLFSEDEEYHKAGGIEGSAGTAVGPVSLAKMEHLGVKDTGRRLILEDIKDNHVLIHELTHALRNRMDRGMPIWAVEGAADYIASAPYSRSGRFDFDDRLEAAVDYVERRRGINGEFEVLMSLEKFLALERSEFYGSLGGTAGRNYAMAVLVFTWLWHADRGAEGKASFGAPMRAWLKAIAAGDKHQTALPLLLDGRTCKQIEEAMCRDYRHDLKLRFP